MERKKSKEEAKKRKRIGLKEKVDFVVKMGGC
jgi:hypothetical protein